MTYSLHRPDPEHPARVEQMRAQLLGRGADIVAYPVSFRASQYLHAALWLPYPDATCERFIMEIATGGTWAVDANLQLTPESDPWLAAIYFFPAHPSDRHLARDEAKRFARRVRASHRRCYAAYGRVYSDFGVLSLHCYPEEQQLLAAARVASDMVGQGWLAAY